MLQTHITNKQKEILLLFYRFRFLNRVHIQTLLHHKSTKNINTWLKDLTDKHYISRIFKRSWTENTKPAKYYISLQGIRFLKTQPDCKKEYLKKLYREKDRSELFIARCLFIADIYLKFLDETKDNASSYQFFTQSDFALDSMMRDLHPHFLIAKTEKQTKTFSIYELFDETTPRYAIRKRINQYLEFFDGEGRELDKRLIIICPEKSYKFINRHIKKLQDEDESLPEMLVATYKQIKQNKIVS